MILQRKFQDERLEKAKNKIATEWFLGIYYFCILSVAVKLFFFDFSFGQCTMEFFILLLTPIFFYIWSRQLGIVFPEQKAQGKRLLVAVALLAAAWLCLAGWLGGRESVINWAATLLIYGFIAIAVGGVIMPKEKARKQRVEGQWSEE